MMKPSNTLQPRAETLADPDGRPLGRVVAPRPGPVVGRASGTIYLIRQPRPVRSPAERNHTGGR